MDWYVLVKQAIELLLGWPLIIYTVVISIICTVALRGVQFRYFIAAWRAIFIPERKEAGKKGDMTPVQAFINTLSANLGNGSVAGAAVALYTGGPGAALWVVVIGLLLMSARFAEVYLSTLYGARAPQGTVLGGPMLYLKDVIGGNVLSYTYAIFCLFFGLIVGNAMQTHAIRLSIQTTWGVQPLVTASVLFVFICYVVFGGASRIIKVSDAIVPVKVIVFVVSSFIVLAYHYRELVSMLQLILTSAYAPSAVAGGVIGFSVQQAMRAGMNLSITATESGLGTAAVLFGFTGSDDPMKSGLMGMISTFVSTCVCFIVALCIMVSGVWDSGLTSTELTVASFNTVFGNFGGWIVSFLSISFGIGVLVTYAYVVRATWLILTNGRFEYMFAVLYCLAAFAGALVDVHLVWAAIALINASMLAINLFGVAYLLPVIRTNMRAATK